MRETDSTRLAAELKRAAALFHEARMVLRRVDRLVESTMELTRLGLG